jgi:eukaryotic-like serine/threonine-protein kinase
VSSEIVPYVQKQDSDEILDEVAMPLFDLRDTSLQALDQYNSTAGDLQSQLLLAYHGSETDSRVFSRNLSESNQLGLNKIIQALSPIPFILGGILAIELSAVWCSFHVGGLAYLALMAICFMFTSSGIFAVIMTGILCKRKIWNYYPIGIIASAKRVLEPDHIAISPQGLNFQWSGSVFSYMGLVLPWRRIALAFIEEHQVDGTGETYEVLCIRDNLGKALRLDCRQFASDVLIKALQKRAPWAVKAPPMALALQPVQRGRWNYLLRWSRDIKRNLTDKKDRRNDIDSLILKNNKYTIVETLPARKFGIDHIAEVSMGNSGSKSKPIALKGLNSNDGIEMSSSSHVKIRQFVLPIKQTWLQWYWTLNDLEREVRRLSAINSNNIVRWLDVFVENGSLYVVTEYDASKSLRDLVRAAGPFTESRVREIALEMCEILLHLHHLDPPYIHKGFTPDALILSKDEFVKLNQFAIGQQVVPSKFYSECFDRRYVSLEQLRGHASVQSDIYSFGGTLFYLLTGEDPKPFQSSNAKSLRPEISERFNAIIVKSTAPGAHLRYDSVESIKEAILELANSETSLVLL